MDFEIQPYEDRDEDGTTYGAKIAYHTYTSARVSKGEAIAEAVDMIDELSYAIENKYTLKMIAEAIEKYGIDLHNLLWEIKYQLRNSDQIYIKLREEESEDSDSS